MFEGRIKDKSCEDPRESSVLHRMRWTDLVARLAATRDLRDELGTVDAGFNAFGEVRRESHEEGTTTPSTLEPAIARTTALFLS